MSTLSLEAEPRLTGRRAIAAPRFLEAVAASLRAAAAERARAAAAARREVEASSRLADSPAAGSSREVSFLADAD